MALNFKEVATKRAEEITRPPNLPACDYIGQIRKLPTITEKVKDQWDIVEYILVPIAPYGDYDDDAIKEYGDITKAQMRHVFMYDTLDAAGFARTEYNHKRFLQEHVKCMTDSESIMEGMNNAVNQQVGFSVTWKQDKNDPEVFHANIAKTFPID